MLTRLSGILVVLLISFPLLSAEVNLSWIPPTENTDGSQIQPGELLIFKIYQNDELIEDVNSDTTNLNLSISVPGNYCYQVTAVNQYQIESEKSNQSCFEVKPPTPKAPMLNQVEVNVSITATIE